MIENILFDVDGVLILSINTCVDTFQSAAVTCGLKKPAFGFLKKQWGREMESFQHVMIKEMSWTSMQCEKVMDVYRSLISQVSFPFHPELAPILEALSKKRRLGLITDRCEESLSRRLGEQGIAINMFEHIELLKMSNTKKPNPMVFNHFWDHGFDPKMSLYVGDTVDRDYLAATRHMPKLKFAGVTCGVCDRIDFAQAGIEPALILRGVMDVPSLLKWL